MVVTTMLTARTNATTTAVRLEESNRIKILLLSHPDRLVTEDRPRLDEEDSRETLST